MFDEGTPIYRQIADQIRRDILTGSLGADDQVMSTTQYATFHRINPATAARAFQELVDEGVLYKRRGVGMFVHADARDELRARRRALFVDEVLAPILAEAERLDFSIDELVDAIRAHAATHHTNPQETADDLPDRDARPHRPLWRHGGPR